MNSTKTNLINKICAILVIFALTVSDFLLIGKTAVSYALEVVKTNNANVEFFAYFLNENGEKVDQMEENIDKKSYLYVDVTVKNEGYFEGAISLGDGNFNLTSNKLSEEIAEISGNTVKLNQINAGSTATIKLEIEAKKEDSVNKAALNGKTKVDLSGQYINSKNVEKQKYVEIKGETEVTVNWKSSEDAKAELDGKVLTNSIYDENGENKRLVQLLVSSNVGNNSYPIKNTKIVLDVPEKVENVRVIARETKGTNSKIEFGEENYSYNKDTHKLEINLANGNEEEISWEKSAKDLIVVTYILAPNETLDEDVNIESKITLYDDKEINGAQKVHIKEDIDGVISSTIETSEEEIYKGKIYSGEERTYTEINKINVDYIDQEEKIEIEQKAAKYVEGENEKAANILYKETRISKEEFQKIFGENGYIVIKNSAGSTIANINKDSEVNEEGKVVITYPNGEKEIKIETSKPENIGTLNIENTKSIQSAGYERKEIEKLTGIKERTVVNQKVAEKVITLKETESNANLVVETAKLSTVADKQELEINATLEANDESKDLYKNPTVTFKLPKEITVNAKEAHYAILYKNGLEVQKENVKLNKKASGETEISVKFNGEQTKYDVTGGTKIYLKLEVAVNKLTPSKTSQIEMAYTNENKNINKVVTADLNLESQYGVMIYNQIANYNNNGDNIVTVDKEVAYGELSTNSDKKEIKLNTALINNFGGDVTDVTLIGRIPSGENEESFNTKLSEIETNNESAKVYYSSVENPEKDDESWGAYTENAKSYKVVIDKMAKEEIVQLNVPVAIEENLKYNKKGNFESEVTAVYDGKTETNNSVITLATKTGMQESSEERPVTEETKTGITSSISANVGNDSLAENDNVYEGQTIRYKVTLTNNTGKDYSNVTIKANQKNGYMWGAVETDVTNPDDETQGQKHYIEHYYKISDSNEVTLAKLDSFKAGESYTYEYEAATYLLSNDKIDGTQTYGTITAISDDKTLNETITTIKNNIKNAELQVTVNRGSTEENEPIGGGTVKSEVNIKNLTSDTLKNIKLRIAFSSNLKGDVNITEKIENKIENVASSLLQNGLTIMTLNIKEINANETLTIEMFPSTDDNLDGKESDNVWILSEAITEKQNSYVSNKFTRKIKNVSLKYDLEQSGNFENGKKINIETDKLSDGDKIEFTATITNNEAETRKIELEYNLDKMIDIQSAKIQTTSEEKDISNEFSYNNLKEEEQTIAAGETIKLSVIGKIETLNIDSVTNKLNVMDTETARISNNELTIKVNKTENPAVNPDDGNEDNGDSGDNGNTGNNGNTGDNGNSGNNGNTGDNGSSGNDGSQENNGSSGDNGNTGNNGSENNGSNNNSGNNSNSSADDEDKKYTISGIVWLDNDKDGRRNSQEELKGDIEVSAINAENGEIVATTKTAYDGTYKLELTKGKYIIVFKYDTNLYTSTIYQVKGANDTENSDAVSREVTINGNKITAATTDTISLNKNISNIDLGLTSKSTFKLDLQKYVSKITVTNDSKTTTYDQKDNTTLAKAEIKSKNLSGSLVVIEYKIKVTNKGDVAGYARNIVDYMPQTLSFNSSMNSDWYISGNNLYNTSLANTKIEPGETKELTLVLTKTMTDSNTGLVNNKAEIAESSNELGIKGETNEKGSANVIISVSTGALVNYVSTTVITLIVLAGLAYLVNKKYLSKKI